MIEAVIWIIVFVASLFVLIKASEHFTHSAEKIGLYFGLPIFIVGVTIVAVGTSLPELISSIFAVLAGSSEIVVGNVVGSNIANIFLILGIAAIISKKLRITPEIIRVDLPVLVVSAFLFTVMIFDGEFTVPEALLSIIGIIIYFCYIIGSQKRHKDVDIKQEMKSELNKKKELHPKTWIILFVSIFFIYIGAKYTIESVVQMSGIFNIGKDIIALGAVALGTSLPELVVSIVAAKKGKPEIAIGNILGSNIFNTFVVMGIPALFGILIIPKSILTFALPMMLVATLLFFFMSREKEITKWEGYFLLMFYVVFIGKILNLF